MSSDVMHAINGFNVTSFVSRGVMMFADTSRGRAFAKDPAVVRYLDKYFLYYSIGPGNGVEGWRIGIATSNDLLNWRKEGEIEASNELEKDGICAPSAIVLKGQIHIFYQTYGNWKLDAICHAWSVDGFRFTRNPTNPVFRPKAPWCCGRAIDADVIALSGRLLLCYATRDPAMKIQMLGMASAPIQSEFSRDAWAEESIDGPIIRPELPWEKKCIEAPALCLQGGKLYMFYAGAFNNEPQQIGCAVSGCGRSWKRLFDQPFLPNGNPGEWNSCESGHPFVFTDKDGTTHLFFQGNDDGGKTWYLSKITIVWENGFPVVQSGT